MNSYPLTVHFLGLSRASLLDQIRQIPVIQHSHCLVKVVHDEVVLEVIRSDTPTFDLKRVILSRLRPFFVGYGQRTVESIVCHRLIQKHLTITSAESLTCGLFQSTLGSFPGISAVFPGGFVTYSNQAKHQLLAVPSSVINREGVVSKATAIWMAKQSRSIMGTDLAVSFTGAAGPDPLEGHPGGTVWIGIAFRKYYRAKLYHFSSLCNSLMPSRSLTISKTRVLQRNLIRRLSVKMGFKMINDLLMRIL